MIWMTMTTLSGNDIMLCWTTTANDLENKKYNCERFDIKRKSEAFIHKLFVYHEKYLAAYLLIYIFGYMSAM